MFAVYHLLHQLSCDCCTGENAVCSQGNELVVRRMEDLQPIQVFRVQDTPNVHPMSTVSAFSLCPLNHHAFVASDDGGVIIYANPILQIMLLENIALELFNL